MIKHLLVFELKIQYRIQLIQIYDIINNVILIAKIIEC